MTEETQILTILEEVLKGLNELKKKPGKEDSNQLTAIHEKLAAIEGQILTIRQKEGQSIGKRDIVEILAKIDILRQERQQEKKHVYVDVKQPLWWIIGAVLVMVLSVFVSYYYYQEKEKYKHYSEVKDWNYMKYRYLKLFGSPGTQREMRDLDVKYDKYYHYYDSLTLRREYELRAAIEAAELARQREAEAKRLKQKADSLENK